jgi:hypothetical protein
MRVVDIFVGCGKNVVFFTLRKMPARSGLRGEFPVIYADSDNTVSTRQ